MIGERIFGYGAFQYLVDSTLDVPLTWQITDAGTVERVSRGAGRAGTEFLGTRPC
ncbi:hypothetical protein [Streptomyces gibsoniae]|uniref:Uncharacterized protein n=1 Tax=Streptomyces gibsoniae TaxID=3075529 RepID=A0ABU2U6J0_9ACTN|nr:hypothetical protein [Streptomyces sp. DSM 41699]MDT0468844.1 hypothetical protein [Streptomyces sp. DSM 41699]